MTDEARRITDLVELNALCARYMLLCSQFIGDRWLEVFTPDATYHAFGSEYGLDRFPALRLIVLEAGAGWLGHWMDRMDGFYRSNLRNMDLLREHLDKAHPVQNSLHR